MDELQFSQRKEGAMDQLQRTLSIVKPDGVRKCLIGEVIGRFERAGLRVVAMKMLHLNKSQAEGFYEVHRGKPFFESLTEFMSSGPVVVMVLEGNDAIRRVRQIMGATDPKKAQPGTIRRDFASDVEQNIVHGSDSPETARFEISYFFSSMELPRGYQSG
jgi:nucleoside-diphosphate kinase